MSALPAPVLAHLQHTVLARLHPTVFSYASDGRFLGCSGEPAVFGAEADPSASADLLRDLFIGMDEDQPCELPFIVLPGGRSTHLHRLPDRDGFHILLLDAGAEHARQQAQQQIANEETLAGQEKSKAIGLLKRIRSDLESERGELEEANALKSALISTLSHEFRTPLTSVFGYLHLLERVIGRDPDAVPALRAIQRNATYLFTLAENLLEYGRGDSGAALLHPDEIDLIALARDVEAMIRPLADDKRLELIFDIRVREEDRPVYDELRVRQILVNLLSNAARYTIAGRIAVGLAFADGQLTIDVADTGPGIPPEYRERIFEPFNRGGPGGRKGAGLGLSIVRRLVQQMGGRITLDSAPGQGSRFRVELPQQVRTTGADAIAETPDRTELWTRARTAIVVDDDPDVAHLLESLLLDLGFKVEIHDNAVAGEAAALREPPDVLLVDVHLSGASGNALVFRLRAQGYRGAIVTVSANASREAHDAALKAGASTFLTKPIELSRFIHTIQRALQRGS
ncbi:MAG TPA: ATP-binding protein [Dokdonella sp.]|uniref:hybrid sensor histidine kinase/response regulator n=1 Tax=Dokdonella sp. TaxID=2291710 RepID=UPI002C1029B7|nr:ATP-binding protein [Dokdonella sp.]HUD43886.1 ATP-binding protein [Dokdonella sp.]